MYVDVFRLVGGCLVVSWTKTAVIKASPKP